MLFTTVHDDRDAAAISCAVPSPFEIVLGFTGLLSDFRGVFVYLAMAALAARIPLKGTTIAASALAAPAS